jgi:hypothetical protein
MRWASFWPRVAASLVVTAPRSSSTRRISIRRSWSSGHGFGVPVRIVLVVVDGRVALGGWLLMNGGQRSRHVQGGWWGEQPADRCGPVACSLYALTAALPAAPGRRRREAVPLRT